MNKGLQPVISHLIPTMPSDYILINGVINGIMENFQSSAKPHELFYHQECEGYHLNLMHGNFKCY